MRRFLVCACVVRRQRSRGQHHILNTTTGFRFGVGKGETSESLSSSSGIDDCLARFACEPSCMEQSPDDSPSSKILAASGILRGGRTASRVTLISVATPAIKLVDSTSQSLCSR
uniref:Uncharacterized protein n=1 Tax=Lygus hesperus TaxID=30085 RepID=A0A0K8SRG3_LYGHE